MTVITRGEVTRLTSPGDHVLVTGVYNTSLYYLFSQFILHLSIIILINLTTCIYLSFNFIYQCTSEFLICFEAWAKFAQQWLVCAPLVIHFDPINKDLMLLVTM